MPNKLIITEEVNKQQRPAAKRETSFGDLEAQIDQLLADGVSDNSVSEFGATNQIDSRIKLDRLDEHDGKYNSNESSGEGLPEDRDVSFISK